MLQVIAGCVGVDMGAPLPPASDTVTVTTLDGVTSSASTTYKRDQLAAEIMRFADRYAGRMSLVAERLRRMATTAELRRFATGWALASQDAPLAISIGPNAVENLLDMLVFATLTRIEVESYWVPQFLPGELGEDLLTSAQALEADIWGIAGEVLTPQQQATLRDTIRDWNDANPDQHYFWYVRFSGFSGQRARDLRRVEQTGGLLAEIQMTREASREIQAIFERLLRYLQHAPASARLNAEFAMREALVTPEVVRALDDANRLSMSSARYADVAERLPKEAERLLDAMFARTALERQALVDQLEVVLARERAAAIEHAARRQQEVITALLESSQLRSNVEKIGEEGRDIVGLTFARGALLVLIWIVAYVLGKLSYEYLKRAILAPAPRDGGP